ncbi:hypothetical protein AWZ03_010156 [Drosophila navojoa]|uniref:Secreted protein n=1 Tax=Drosophila navojoa TaxID=7232 RepID=A0A484B569_DRONA|nr:hypothetical protein AWZ03_010156 [Drosophila navojoa]
MLLLRLLLLLQQQSIMKDALRRMQMKRRKLPATRAASYLTDGLHKQMPKDTPAQCSKFSYVATRSCIALLLLLHHSAATSAQHHHHHHHRDYEQHNDYGTATGRSFYLIAGISFCAN